MAEGDEYHLGTHETPIGYHGMLVGDPHRVVAYDRAIRKLVKPGDVVLDLGAGTGILAMLAARRGARVHAVESGRVAQVAEALVARNRLADRITLHRGDMRDLPVAEPVDWVISDFMGRFLVDDGMLGAVRAAAAWMKPGAGFCPRKLALYLAPIRVAVPSVQVFDTDVLGLDLRPALPYTWNTCYASHVGPPGLLAHGQRYHAFSPPETPPPFDATLAFDVPVDAAFTGFAGWFDADLAPGVLLSTAPGTQTHWGQYLFPVPRTDVRAGDRIEVHLWLQPPLDDPDWHWTTRVLRDGEEVAAYDLESEERLGERDLPADPLPEPLDRDQILAVNQAAAEAFLAARLPEAIEGLERAVRAIGPEEDDLALLLYENLGMARYNAGDHEGAARALLRSLDGDPARSAQGCRFLVLALHQGGRIHDAATWLRRYREHHGEHPEFPSRSKNTAGE